MSRLDLCGCPTLFFGGRPQEIHVTHSKKLTLSQMKALRRQQSVVKCNLFLLRESFWKGVSLTGKSHSKGQKLVTADALQASLPATLSASDQMIKIM